MTFQISHYNFVFGKGSGPGKHGRIFCDALLKVATAEIPRSLPKVELEVYNYISMLVAVSFDIADNWQ